MELTTASSKTSQVASRLRRMIKKGNCKPGTRLASTRQLAQQFKVSAKTVKCALDVLQA
jgi:DNA-binding GntR family transcriptional regulator